jgi:hypothetical protein
MAWIPFDESLLKGKLRGLSRAARFVYCELALHARAGRGRIELPVGMDDIAAVHDVVGGDRHELTCTLSQLAQFEIEGAPLLGFEGPPGGRVLVVVGWSERFGVDEPARRDRARSCSLGTPRADTLTDGDLLPDERVILDRLRTASPAPPPLEPIGALAGIARPAFARQIAGYCGPGAQLRLEDVLRAIDEAAARTLGEHLTMGIADDARARADQRLLAHLVSRVLSFVQNARRLSAEGRASAPVLADPGEVHAFLDAFDARWKRRWGEARARGEQDVDIAARIVRQAGDESARVGLALRDIAKHWILRFLASTDDALVHARHPLAWFPPRIATLGLPDPAAVRDSRVAVPPGPATEVATPDEVLRILEPARRAGHGGDR